MTAGHLVCVAPCVPYVGIDHAGGDYVLGYLAAAHELGWQVTVISPDSDGNRGDRQRAPQWLTVLLAPADRPSALRRATRLVRRGVSAIPPRAWYRGLDPQAKEALESATIIDLQWMAGVQYASLLRWHHPQTPILGTPHDVKSQSFERARFGPNRTLAVGAALALPAIRRTESKATRACDRLYLFKAEDTTALRRHGGTAQLEIAPPLIRLPPDAPAADPTSSTLLFPAAFWRDENDEAASWFLAEVWPSIVTRYPEARIRFAGSRPSTWLQAQRGQHVEVTGYLTDLLEAYRGVGVVVAPIRRGAGLKFKVAQAVAMGYPVVGTSVAIEGLNGMSERPLLTAHDGATAFAAEVVDTLTNLDRRVAAAQEAATAIRARFDFNARIRAQIRSYSDLRAGSASG